MKILVKNALIVTLDDKNTIIENGFLGTDGRVIEFVSDKIPAGYEWDEVIDAKGRALMPGLSNAHCHTAMTILRGCSEGYPLQEWLTEKIFPIEAKLTPEDIYYGTLLGIAEMIRTGTTLVNDTYYFMDMAAKAYMETGINANISRCVLNDSESGNFAEDYRISECVDLIDEFHGADDGRIMVEVFPHAVYTCSLPYLTYVADLAEEKNVSIHSHLSENETEVRECLNKYNMTPPEVYKKAGLFKRPATMSHCVHLTDSDISILKGHTIVHNPTSNLKLGSGIANIVKYKGAGLCIALGTDGASSNNNLNMFEEMHLCALLASGINNDPSLIQTEEVLRMATINGAKAMGRKNKGVLKAGFDADFILIRSDEVYYYPNHNIMNNIVYTAQGPDVTHTVCAGKILYQNGEYKTMDIERVKYEMMRIKERLF